MDKHEEHSRKPLLYEQVAGQIERMIETGVLRPGEKAPSVRNVSRQQQVSMSTAFEAYYHLEIKGLVEARPRSGFYVRVAPRKIEPLVTKSTPAPTASLVKVHDLVAEILYTARNPDIIPLGTASISEELFPTAKLQKLLFQAMREAPERAIKYDFSGGMAELKRAIARRSADWQGSLTTDDVIITAGCMEALTLALRAVARAGDVIAVESPTYFGVLQAIESLGLKALEIPTSTDTGICLDALERALETENIAAVMIVSNFSNPLGNMLSDERKKVLGEMLAKREIPLIEDDIYGDLYFGTTRPKTVKTFDEKGLVLLCSSFSKTLAPGYRIGWIAPGRFYEKVFRLKQMSSNGTSNPPQMAIAAFLQSGKYDKHLRGLRAALSGQLQRGAEAVAKHFPAGTRISRPVGGTVLWVELPEHIDSLLLYRRALEENISIVPGLVFSAQDKYRNFIRLSFGRPFDERIEGAICRLGEMIEMF